jgi:endoglucanase
MYTILKDIMCTPSISGRETAVANKIRSYIEPLVDECYVDALGNLIALKKGSAEDKKRIMLCAHMDEIGFLVTFIEESGYIRIAPVGGINFLAYSFNEVVSENGVPGVLVPEGRVAANELSADKVYIDIGAKNKKEAERKVKIGDFFVVRSYAKRMCGTRLMGRPFDDRVACAILIDLAKKITAPKNDVYYVFSVQEEVGCRGSKTAAFAIEPDYALAFDVTGTGDTIGARPMACKLGDGAAIKIKDSSVICDMKTVEKLTALAKENKIKHQHEILTFGGTDTSSMQIAKGGCLAAALSIPSRYIHSGVEMIDLADAEACVALAEKFIESIGK